MTDNLHFGRRQIVLMAQEAGVVERIVDDVDEITFGIDTTNMTWMSAHILAEYNG